MRFRNTTFMCMCKYVYIYIYTVCTYIYIYRYIVYILVYIYIYIYRERERDSLCVHMNMTHIWIRKCAWKKNKRVKVVCHLHAIQHRRTRIDAHGYEDSSAQRTLNHTRQNMESSKSDSQFYDVTQNWLSHPAFCGAPMSKDSKSWGSACESCCHMESCGKRSVSSSKVLVAGSSISATGM